MFNLEGRVREDFIALCNYLKEACAELEVGLFSRVMRSRTRENGFKLCRGWFRLYFRKKIFTRRVVKHANRLLREWLSLHP